LPVGNRDLPETDRAGDVRDAEQDQTSDHGR
jgi:hypothetical protein